MYFTLLIHLTFTRTSSTDGKFDRVNGYNELCTLRPTRYARDIILIIFHSRVAVETNSSNIIRGSQFGHGFFFLNKCS